MSKKKKGLIVLLCIAILFLWIPILENIPKNIEFGSINKVAENNNRTQGDYVLYTEESGISQFPYVFGETVYLYSIDKDKSYLMATSKLPLSGYSSDLTIIDDRIFFEKADPTGGISW